MQKIYSYGADACKKYTVLVKKDTDPHSGPHSGIDIVLEIVKAKADSERSRRYRRWKRSEEYIHTDNKSGVDENSEVIKGQVQ